MLWLKKIQKWLKRKPRPPDFTANELGAAVTKDLGVIITRIPLPSGGEVVVIERVYDDFEAEAPADESTH